MSGNSSDTPLSPLLYHCINSYIASLLIRTVLLLPLSTFILCLGLQRWRQQQRSSKSPSHIDMFTYQLCVMELLWISGSVGFLCVLSSGVFILMPIVTSVFTAASYGKVLLSSLTCVEQYIAVVHPLTYLRLRSTSGVRIRNISIGCVWMLSVGLIVPQLMTGCCFSVVMLILSVFSIILTSFCSLFVLYLLRPKSGGGGGHKDLVDKSKRRAFNTITTISSMQWFGTLGLLVSSSTDESDLSFEVSCLMEMSLSYSYLPSCLVLPLLYLHRAGKLACRKKSNVRRSQRRGNNQRAENIKTLT